MSPRIVALLAQIASAQAIVAGYVAENARCAFLGEPPEYAEHLFAEQADRLHDISTMALALETTDAPSAPTAGDDRRHFICLCPDCVAPRPDIPQSDSGIWVVVSDSDGVKVEDGPLVHETYTIKATREDAIRRATELADVGGNRYGGITIARLVFEDWFAPTFADVPF